MSYFNLTLLFCMLNAFAGGDYLLSSRPKILTSIAANHGTGNDVEPEATDIIFQSTDGGETWQDISHSLPGNEQPEVFFAGDSDLYLRIKNEMYRSKSNLETPVWEKENGLNPQNVSIAFNRSGVVAYNYEGQIYQKTRPSGTWLPIFPNFQTQSMRSIFETSDGTLFLGFNSGIYKSADNGQNWNQVQDEGGFMQMVEAEGVLVATGRRGIMRSTDNGEHWEWVIREGGVGIAIERITGGFAAISCNTTTMSRRVYVSSDSGKTWKAIDEGLQPSLLISSIKQVGEYLLCGHPDGIFRSSDMGKTWNMVHSGVDKKVFRIYVSGGIVYAVAGGGGC